MKSDPIFVKLYAEYGPHAAAVRIDQLRHGAKGNCWPVLFSRRFNIKTQEKIYWDGTDHFLEKSCCYKTENLGYNGLSSFDTFLTKGALRAWIDAHRREKARRWPSMKPLDKTTKAPATYHETIMEVRSNIAGLLAYQGRDRKFQMVLKALLTMIHQDVPCRPRDIKEWLDNTTDTRISIEYIRKCVDRLHDEIRA